jgi:hypothetical protein
MENIINGGRKRFGRSHGQLLVSQCMSEVVHYMTRHISEAIVWDYCVEK